LPENVTGIAEFSFEARSVCPLTAPDLERLRTDDTLTGASGNFSVKWKVAFFVRVGLPPDDWYKDWKLPDQWTGLTQDGQAGH
jgi:hypothetical protein